MFSKRVRELRLAQWKVVEPDVICHLISHQSCDPVLGSHVSDPNAIRKIFSDYSIPPHLKKIQPQSLCIIIWRKIRFIFILNTLSSFFMIYNISHWTFIHKDAIEIKIKAYCIFMYENHKFDACDLLIH